jgi:lipoic acid synthetase
VTKSNGKTSRVIDSEEPKRIQEAVKKLGLDYVVITSVTRDDLIDGGAGIFAETIKLIRALEKDIKVEVLIPDFKGRFSSLQRILDTSPDVIGHNLETVRRLFSSIRPQANYELSLEILRQVKKTNLRFITKSSLMLGLGETTREVKETLQDLRQARCDILTLGQYLAPSPKHYPVKEYIDWEKFIQYKELAVNLGFKKVLSGPLVRSSYQAEELYREFSYV